MKPPILLVAAVGSSAAAIISASSSSLPVTAIRAGRVMTMNGPTIERGTILIRGGRIQAVGSNISLPAQARIIDASTQVVIPGLIAAHSTLAESAGSEENITPELRASESFDYYRDYTNLLECGITAAYVAPGDIRLLGGQGGVIKLAGVSSTARRVRDRGDYRLAFGQSSESPPPLFRPPLPPSTDDPILPAQRQLGASLASQVAVIRQLLADSTSVSGSSKGALGTVARELAEGGSLRIRAHRVSEIQAAIKLTRQNGVRLTLEGVTEGYRVAREIAASKAPAVVVSPIRFGDFAEMDSTRPTANGKVSRQNLRELFRAGVTAALAPAEDSDLTNLLMLAAAEVSQGVSPESALKSITSNAATALGVGNRIGAIKPGLDADLVFLNGNPLDSRTHVEAAMINGEFAFRRKTAEPADTLAIKAGRILTVTQGEIQNGAVIIRGGKIAEVNRTGLVPPGAKVIDASNGVVMPGMIDSHSHLGLHNDSAAPPAESAALVGSASGRSSLLKAIVPGDTAFAGAVREGVTTVLLAPTTSGPVSGRASLIKTAECSGHGVLCAHRVLKDSAGICFNVSAVSPRMAQPWTFKEQLQRARDYLQRRARYEQELMDWNRDRDEAARAGKPIPREPTEVAPDEDLVPFSALFDKQIPALIHASRSDEITNALKVFSDEVGLPVVLIGAGDGFRIPDEIRRRGARVSITPGVLRRVGGHRINLGQRLATAGIETIFHSSSPTGAELLRLNAALAVRQGMNPEDALRSLTIWPAKAFKVDNRIGSIEVGKDADIVILSGDPLEAVSRIRKVLVNGKVAYDAS